MSKQEIAGTNTLHFGVMCNSLVFQHWQAMAIDALVNEGYQLVLFVCHDEPDKRISFLQKLINYPYRLLMYRLVQRYLSRPQAKRPVNCSSKFAGVQVINCKTKKKGFSQYFYQTDLEAIKTFQLDFVLRFGFSIIKGDILDLPLYGIWSYHHDDPEKYRGVPTGFWEIYYNDPVNAAVLQRLTDKIDSGIILKKGWFKTQMHSWSGNIDHLYYGAAHWPLQVAKAIVHGKEQSVSQNQAGKKAKLYKLPTNRRMMIFLWKLFLNKVKFHFRELFRAEKWKVGIIRRSPGEIMDNPIKADEIYWLPDAGDTQYFADPFIQKSGDKLFIVCERYDYSEGKGSIELLKWDISEEEVTKQWPLVRRKTHMAYPYLFNVNNNTYCLPENADSGLLELYRFDKEQVELKFEADLIDEIDAVDTTLFKSEKHWWLLFTRKDYSSENLYAWYADELTGPYQPHRNNPVKTDIRSSRPAGNLFKWQNQLIRPAQDGSRTYGGRIALNSFKELSPHTFKEETIGFIEPDFHPTYKKGVHTISTSGNYTAIDCKKHTFITSAFFGQMKRKLGRLLGRKDR